MSASEPLYNTRERTGNPDHASVDDVIELVLERAQTPREDHQDAHLDEAMAAVVNRYGSETVRTIVQRVLVNNYPFRTATVGLDVDNIDGIRIGTIATQFLVNRLGAKPRGFPWFSRILPLNHRPESLGWSEFLARQRLNASGS